MSGCSPCSECSAITPRRTVTDSTPSPDRCASPTSTTRSAPPSRSTVRRRTDSRRTSGAATSGCDSFPEGFLVMGDASCSFNPIYGQGMTVAALQALTLRDHLTPGVARRTPRVLHALARVHRRAVGAGDRCRPGRARGVDGRRTPRRRIAGAYVARLTAAAAHDPALARAFMRVTGLVDPPEAILRPAIALRVLRPHRRSTTAAQRRNDESTVSRARRCDDAPQHCFAALPKAAASGIASGFARIGSRSWRRFSVTRSATQLV